MKIERQQEKKEFIPIILTLETVAEVAVLRTALFQSLYGGHVDDCALKYSSTLTQGLVHTAKNSMWDGTQQILKEAIQQ
jgi:hypothetical protein